MPLKKLLFVSARMAKMQEIRFVRMCVAMSTLGLAIVAIVNLVVNPFAQYPTRFCRPLVQTSRSEKVERLSNYSTAPDGLIMGSSRVLKYEPAYLRSRTGQTFYNAGVNYGKPEDYLAMLRYYQRRFGRMPKTVLIGLDVHGFNHQLKTDARLLSHKQLVSCIADTVPWRDRFQSSQELLSWQQFMASLRSIRCQLGAKANEPEVVFSNDGLADYVLRQRQIDRQQYDFQSALQYNQREYKSLFENYDRLSRNRLVILREALESCQAAGTQVVLFLTPMHPELAAYIRGVTTYKDRKAELIATLEDWSASGNFRFEDMSDLAQFDGTADQFIDGVHPLESNTRKVIDRLFPRIQGLAQHAIQ